MLQRYVYLPEQPCIILAKTATLQKSIKKEIANLFESAFPRDERPSTRALFKSLERKENKLITYYLEDIFIGFTFLTFYQDVCYIFFLAVSKDYRHQGFGGQIIEYIKKQYSHYVLLLGYEEIDPKYPNYL